MSTFRSYTEALQTGIRWAKGFYGIRLTGTAALHCDLIAEGVNQAIKARFPKFAAPDAYPYIGANVNLERFPNDTNTTYRDRLSHGFSIWQQAGTKQGLERGFDFFGLPFAQVFEDKDWLRPPQPYWSQFWVFFPGHAQTGGSTYGPSGSYGGVLVFGQGITYPGGLNPVTGSGSTYGSAGSYGAGLLYGITGLTAEQVEGLRRLVRKWKRSASICREMIFEVTTQFYGSPGLTYGSGLKYGIVITYGTGHTYGDGSQYGGTQAIIGGI